jgi:DNA-binding MarR family transcriptional regulator
VTSSAASALSISTTDTQGWNNTTPPATEPDEEHLLAARINRVSAAIGDEAAAKVAPLGLDDRMIAVLLAAQALGSPSQKEIADHTRIDRTTVSKTIDQLEASGLVTRRIDTRHRRRHRIELTPKATRTLSCAKQLFTECDAEFLAVLSEPDRRPPRTHPAKARESPSRVTSTLAPSRPRRALALASEPHTAEWRVGR